MPKPNERRKKSSIKKYVKYALSISYEQKKKKIEIKMLRY